MKTIFLFLSTVAFSCALASSPTNPWPNFRGNFLNNGNNALSIRVDNSKDSAKMPVEFSTQGIVWGTPVVDAEGNVYVGTSHKLFHKFNSAGKLLWTFRIKDLPDSLIDSAATLTPSGKVIVPGGDGFLHALDQRTGKELWTFAATDADPSQQKTGETVNSFEGNVTNFEGMIYAGCDNGYVYALDDNGKKIWSFRTDMMVWSSPAFSPDGSWMVFGSLDRHLYLLDPKTGKLLAKTKTEGDVKSSPATDGKTIYFGSSAEKVIAVEVQKKPEGYALVEKWSFATAGEVYASPALKKDTVFIGTLRGFFYSLSARNGSLQWTYNAHSPIASSATITADDVLVFGAKNSKVYTLDSKTGERLWSYQSSSSLYKTNIDSSPTVFSAANNIPSIAAGSYGGKIFFLPANYCPLHKSDRKCEFGGIEDTIAHEKQVAPNAAELRFVDRDGRLFASGKEKIGLFEPVQLQLIAYENGQLLSNAAISTFPLHVEITPKIEIRSVVSSDGSLLNILPVHGFEPDTKYRIQVSGRYYRNTHWVWNRLKWIGLKSFSADIEFSSLAKGSAKQETAPDFKLWGIDTMYLTQPQALDTYIPAALDGQAFLVTGFGFQASTGKFLMLAQPALPSDPAPLPLPEPSKSFVLEAEQRGEHFQATGSMAIAAMGGAMKFDEAILSGIFGKAGVIERGEFFVNSSCLSIKGNGSDYQFPLSLVSWVCDHRLHVIGLGSLQGKSLAAPVLKEAKELSATAEIREGKFELSITAADSALKKKEVHLVNFVEFSTDEVRVTKFAAGQMTADCWKDNRKCLVRLPLESKEKSSGSRSRLLFIDQQPVNLR